MPTPFELAARSLRSLYGVFIHTPPFLDKDAYFPGARALEERWRDIADEARVVLDDVRAVPKFHELLADQYSISANDDSAWHMFVLRAYGRDQDTNMARCPRTAALLRALPEVTSATFSILEGRKHIPAHRGPYRGILRYQLGLVIPTDARGEPQATLRVADAKYRWRAGEGVLWDDTYEHEVWNESDGWRIVFLLDVLRPDMPLVPRLLHKVIYGGVRRSPGMRAFLARSEVPARSLSAAERDR
jgi:aspartate beta-hydroxylase